jgi:hypothetical protein
MPRGQLAHSEYGYLYGLELNLSDKQRCNLIEEIQRVSPDIEVPIIELDSLILNYRYNDIDLFLSTSTEDEEYTLKKIHKHSTELLNLLQMEKLGGLGSELESYMRQRSVGSVSGIVNALNALKWGSIRVMGSSNALIDVSSYQENKIIAMRELLNIFKAIGLEPKKTRDGTFEKVYRIVISHCRFEEKEYKTNISLPEDLMPYFNETFE